jgi:hypothetical protein
VHDMSILTEDISAEELARRSGIVTETVPTGTPGAGDVETQAYDYMSVRKDPYIGEPIETINDEYLRDELATLKASSNFSYGSIGSLSGVKSKYIGLVPEKVDLGSVPDIQSVEGDLMSFDPLKFDTLAKEVDPKSKVASNRVATYYEEYGLALLPEDVAVVNNAKLQTQSELDSAMDNIVNYQTQFREALAKGDIEGAKSLASIPNVSKYQVPTTRINVTADPASGGGIEGSYDVASSVVDALLAEPTMRGAMNDKGEYDLSVVSIGGHQIGGALHEALLTASIRTEILQAQADNIAAEAQYVRDANAQALQNEITAQRNNAISIFDQQMEQGIQQYDYAAGSFDRFLADLKAKNTAAQEATNNSLAQLQQSGILSWSAPERV